MFEILENCPLFTGLSLGEITHLMNITTHQIKQYKKDNMIVFSGDEVIGQLIVLEGSVKAEMVDFSGKIIKIEDIEKPHPLASAFLFGKKNRYPVNLIANNNVTILVIPKASFLKLLQKNEVILNNFLNNISNRAQFLSDKIRFLSFQSIKEKIAHYILELSKQKASNHFTLSESQNQLAELFGVTRPSMGRTIREMHNEGYFKAHGKETMIDDKSKLLELIK